METNSNGRARWFGKNQRAVLRAVEEHGIVRVRSLVPPDASERERVGIYAAARSLREQGLVSARNVGGRSRASVLVVGPPRAKILSRKQEAS